MILYLVQHAEAVSKKQDPQRPLSSKGLADIKKIAEFAAKNCHKNSLMLIANGYWPSSS